MPELATTGGGYDEGVRSAVEEALNTPALTHMPPGLEALFEQQRGSSRRHKLARALIVVGTMCLLTSVLEATISWHFALHALPLRVSVTVLCFLGAFLLGGVAAPWQEAVCVALPLLAAMAITQALGEVAPARVADRYLLLAPMIVATFVAAVPLRLSAAFMLCVAGAICTIFVFAFSPPPLGLADNWDEVLFSAGIMAIAFAVARRGGITRRRSFLYGLRYELSAQEMTLLNAKLLRLSSTDMLTGLSNRRQFELELERLWLEQPGQDLGVALIDVDHFKLFNDSAGHAAGDSCLRAVAQAVTTTLRPETDRAARFGGEEFVVLMPAVNPLDLPALGEKLRRAVEDLAMPHPGQSGRNVTISVGLAWSAAAGRAGPADVLLRDADRAMYAAKHAGRNRVALADTLNIAAE